MYQQYGVPTQYGQQQFQNQQVVSPTQMRLNQFEQMMYQQQQQQFQGVLKGRPVTSFDEAKASSIDFDGSISFFPDLANGKIYTKQINLDGTASLKEYKQTTNDNTESTLVQSDNEAVNYKEQIESLQKQIDDLNNKVSVMGKGGNTNVQRKSNANDANV